MGSERIVTGVDESNLRVTDAEATGATLLAALGAAFLLVGLVDLALLWWPLRFESSAWEFATLSRTLGSVPMSGLGLGLLAYGLVRHPRSSGTWVRVFAVLFLVAAAGFVVMGGLYVTVVPDVLRDTPPEGMTGVNRALIKNSAEVVCYTIIFALIGFRMWGSVEKIS